MAAAVLVVEDDPAIGDSVTTSLRQHGYDVRWARDGAEATEHLEQTVPELLLLDAGLPDVDGFSLCRWVREQHRSLPIIIVTARDAEIDIVVGLDAGADDYVTKPFSMSVLLARIRAHLRDVVTPDPTAPVTIGRLHLDPAAYLASVDGEVVQLRPREFELLAALARDVAKVVTRERLLADVWDLHWETSTKTLDMHVLALRRKLDGVVEITTVRGVGYRLEGA
jgi:DNA-binding response OmpR family regulator